MNRRRRTAVLALVGALLVLLAVLVVVGTRSRILPRSSMPERTDAHTSQHSDAALERPLQLPATTTTREALAHEPGSVVLCVRDFQTRAGVAGASIQVVDLLSRAAWEREHATPPERVVNLLDENWIQSRVLAVRSKRDLGTTDAQGELVLPATERASGALLVIAHGYCAGLMPLPPDGEEVPTVWLEPSGSLRVSVHAPDGGAIADAIIGVARAAVPSKSTGHEGPATCLVSARGTWPALDETARADASGVALVSGLPVGPALFVHTSGSTRSEWVTTRIPSQHAIVDVDVTGYATGHVFGRLVDDASQPVRGVTVRLVSAPPLSWTSELVAGSDGKFQFSDVPSGPCWASVNRGGAAPLAFVVPPGEGVDLGDVVLAAEGLLKIHVRTDALACGFDHDFVVFQRDALAGLARLDAAGNGELRVPHGPAVVVVRAGGREIARVACSVPGNVEVPVRDPEPTVTWTIPAASRESFTAWWTNWNGSTDPVAQSESVILKGGTVLHLDGRGCVHVPASAVYFGLSSNETGLGWFGRLPGSSGAQTRDLGPMTFGDGSVDVRCAVDALGAVGGSVECSSRFSTARWKAALTHDGKARMRLQPGLWNVELRSASGSLLNVETCAVFPDHESTVEFLAGRDNGLDVVVTQDGVPAAREKVTVLIGTYRVGLERLTDERGEIHLSSLAPATYVVTAGAVSKAVTVASTGRSAVAIEIRHPTTTVSFVHKSHRLVGVRQVGVVCLDATSDAHLATQLCRGDRDGLVNCPSTPGATWFRVLDAGTNAGWYSGLATLDEGLRGAVVVLGDREVVVRTSGPAAFAGLPKVSIVRMPDGNPEPAALGSPPPPRFLDAEGHLRITGLVAGCTVRIADGETLAGAVALDVVVGPELVTVVPWPR